MSGIETGEIIKNLNVYMEQTVLQRTHCLINELGKKNYRQWVQPTAPSCHATSQPGFSLLEPACWQDTFSVSSRSKLTGAGSILWSGWWGLSVTWWVSLILEWILGCSPWLPISTTSSTSILLLLIKLILICAYVSPTPYFSIAFDIKR